MARELSIGEVSERSGVSQSALRFYERRGLIAARRTDGNQRRYPSVTLRRVALVQAGKAAGIPLDRIREALDALPDGKRLSSAWHAELNERIATLEAVRDRLTTCIGCGCLSLQTCRLLNPDDEAASRGGGAHYLRRVSPRGRHVAQRAR